MPAKCKPAFIITQAPGVGYYRAAMWANKLGGQYWPKQALECLPNWEEILNYDVKLLYDMEKVVADSTVVVWQRLSTFRGFATLMGMKQKYKQPMYVEIDDDALHVDSANPGFRLLNPESEAYKVFKLQMKHSNGIIVSTETLRKAYKKYNKNIIVMPNSIDFNVWKKKEKDNKKVKIIWQGAMHHHNDLGLLLPVIPKILKKHDVEFHFFGYQPDSLKINGCRFYPPTIIQKYPKKFAEINPDIAIAPLMDTYLNRARSNLRVIESGAFGIPVVATASKKLPYQDIIEESNGGLLAKNTDEWVEGLDLLISNKSLRKEMGNNLHDYVKQNFNLASNARILEGQLTR